MVCFKEVFPISVCVPVCFCLWNYTECGRGITIKIQLDRNRNSVSISDPLTEVFNLLLPDIDLYGVGLLILFYRKQMRPTYMYVAYSCVLLSCPVNSQVLWLSMTFAQLESDCDY